MTDYTALAKQFCPDFYFHHDERFFPCSIEYLLENGSLKDYNDPDFCILNPSQSDLLSHSGSNFYVDINSSQQGGQMIDGVINAPVYYAIQEYSDCLEIHYLLLYAHQGGQTCRALRAGTEFNCIASTLGIHQGDLERVVVRLIREGDSYSIFEVGYEAHGDLTFYPTQRISLNGTHPSVQVALNGHAFHNSFIEGDRVTEFEQPGLVAVIAALSISGIVWQPYNSSVFAQLGLIPDSEDETQLNPINDQLWSAFKGRLGKQQNNSFESATYFDGSGLSGLDWTFVKGVDFFADRLDKYPDSIKDGNGPTGPADRPWISPQTIASPPLFNETLRVLQALNDTGQGDGAIAWLSAKLYGVDQSQMVQLWDHDDQLGIIVYNLNAQKQFETAFMTGDIGQGSGAKAFLVGNFYGDTLDTTPDHAQQIVQCWANGSQLGIIVYGSNGSNEIVELWSTSDIGQGAGAVSWQVGDFNGDGKDELLQCWANGSSLGFILYGCDSDSAAFKTLWGTEDIGQGDGAVSWQVGDFNGDGKTELLQCWDDDNHLNFILYGSDDANGLRVLSTSGTEQGSGAVSWQVGDFNGDGKDELLQCWANGSSLGFILYGLVDKVMAPLWSTGDIGQGVGAVSWQVGDFNGDGKDELLQCWASDNNLGFLVYGTAEDSNELSLLWSGIMGDGPNAVTWITGDFTGQGKDEVIQGWSNGDQLGLILYGKVNLD